MNPNEELIQRFYEAFQTLDAEAMAACYRDDVRFWDPVFQDLSGESARNMWRMLCGRAKDLKIEVSDVTADDTTGAAHWDARYTFSTGRKVLNRVDAKFEFSDGKIAKHTDTFDLKVWAGQALGPAGKLLGGTSFMQKKIRATAMKGLNDFEAKSG